MKPFQINLITGIVLIAMGVWSYLSSGSPTALIPAAFGIIFAVVTPMFRKGNRVVAHIVVILTLLLIIALFRPLTGAINDGDTMGIVRVGIMMGVSVIALIIYIKSFIDARRARNA
jgi:hypothetical protein